MIPDPANHMTTGSLPPGNRSPVAVAAASELLGVGALSVDFDASESYDPDGDSLTYQWDFGDGNGAIGVSPSHTFVGIADGDLVFHVRLTVVDPEGALSADEIAITVEVGSSE
jgi:PKD repeat protein